MKVCGLAHMHYMGQQARRTHGCGVQRHSSAVKCGVHKIYQLGTLLGEGQGVDDEIDGALHAWEHALRAWGAWVGGWFASSLAA